MVIKVGQIQVLEISSGDALDSAMEMGKYARQGGDSVLRAMEKRYVYNPNEYNSPGLHLKGAKDFEDNEGKRITGGGAKAAHLSLIYQRYREKGIPLLHVFAASTDNAMIAPLQQATKGSGGGQASFYTHRQKNELNRVDHFPVLGLPTIGRELDRSSITHYISNLYFAVAQGKHVCLPIRNITPKERPKESGNHQQTEPLFQHPERPSDITLTLPQEKEYSFGGDLAPNFPNNHGTFFEKELNDLDAFLQRMNRAESVEDQTKLIEELPKHHQEAFLFGFNASEREWRGVHEHGNRKVIRKVLLVELDEIYIQKEGKYELDKTYLSRLEKSVKEMKDAGYVVDIYLNDNRGFDDLPKSKDDLDRGTHYTATGAIEELSKRDMSVSGVASGADINPNYQHVGQFYHQVIKPYEARVLSGKALTELNDLSPMKEVFNKNTEQKDQQPKSKDEKKNVVELNHGYSFITGVLSYFYGKTDEVIHLSNKGEHRSIMLTDSEEPLLEESQATVIHTINSRVENLQDKLCEQLRIRTKKRNEQPSVSRKTNEGAASKPSRAQQVDDQSNKDAKHALWSGIGLTLASILISTSPLWLPIVTLGLVNLPALAAAILFVSGGVILFGGILSFILSAVLYEAPIAKPKTSSPKQATEGSFDDNQMQQAIQSSLEDKNKKNSESDEIKIQDEETIEGQLKIAKEMSSDDQTDQDKNRMLQQAFSNIQKEPLPNFSSQKATTGVNLESAQQKFENLKENLLKLTPQGMETPDIQLGQGETSSEVQLVITAKDLKSLGEIQTIIETTYTSYLLERSVKSPNVHTPLSEVLNGLYRFTIETKYLDGYLDELGEVVKPKSELNN